MESATFIRKLLDQGAFTVDQYSTSNEITRFNNFRTVDPGDFVWAGESYDHLQIPSKNKPFAGELRFCYAEIFRVALPFMVLIRIEPFREAQKMVSLITRE